MLGLGTHGSYRPPGVFDELQMKHIIEKTCGHET